MATLKRSFTTCFAFALSCLLASSIQIFFFSPISPVPLSLPLPSPLSQLPCENLIQNVKRLGDGFLKDPEDVCFDSKGVLYTATRDGWIKRLTNVEYYGSNWENWKLLNNSNSLLGITATRHGSIIVCDAEEGLIEVEEDRVTVLLSHVNGTKLRFADDVIEAADGSLYFSVASTKFGLHNWYLDVLEARPHGQLLRFEPSSNRTSLVLDNLGFANGVALSQDQDFLVVCETWRFRCLKHWLSGESKGKTEVFIENLPSGPDNINLAPDGSFWISLIQLASKRWEFLHTSMLAKHLVAMFPKLVKIVTEVTYSRATVIKVGADGSVLRKIEDSQGKVMSFVTSAVEFEGHLYLGSLNSNFIGKLPLDSDS